MFYLTTHSTHFIYDYMTSDIWLRIILIVREVTRCRNMGYSFRLTARVLLHAPSHRQDNTYHGLCYTSRGALAGMRNSPGRIDLTTPSLRKEMFYLMRHSTHFIYGYMTPVNLFNCLYLKLYFRTVWYISVLKKKITECFKWPIAFVVFHCDFLRY